ncbi:MAG: SDR family oxidoreductase [Nitrospinales bacterium]
MPAAIITGGGVRIGGAFACHLADRGYDIALLYHSSGQAAEKTLDKVNKCGVRGIGYACDFKNLGEVETLIGKISADFPETSLLINSAANFIQEDIEHTSAQSILDTFNINLLSPYLLMREYRKHFNRGMIVNILDERINRNVPTFAAYSVSKAGLAHLTRLGAVEWGDRIRVNGIAPGLILPPAGGPGDYLERGAKKIPVRRHGHIEDLLKGLDYLIDSPFVNGEILFIDGGESIGSAYPFRPEA